MDIHIDDESLIAAEELLKQISDKTNKMSRSTFKSVVCMIIEEYCKENGLDAVKETKECLAAIKFFHAVLGEY